MGCSSLRIRLRLPVKRVPYLARSEKSLVRIVTEYSLLSEPPAIIKLER